MTPVQVIALAAVILAVIGLATWWVTRSGHEGTVGTRSSPNQGPDERTDSQFPFELQLEGFVVHIHLKTFESRNGVVPTWVFVTDGLREHGQSEIVLAIVRDAAEPPESVPEEPLSLLVTRHQHASDGGLVRSGDFMRFPPLTFGGFAGVLFAPCPPLEGVTHPERALAGVLLREEEVEAALAFGSARVLARLGERHRYYPFPPWADPERETVALPEREGASVLQHVKCAHLPRASVLKAPKGVVTRIARCEQEPLREALRDIPPEGPFALLVVADPEANAHLVWQGPEQEGVCAIHAQDSDASRISACFLMLAGVDDREMFRILEDGFVFVLDPEAMRRVRGALLHGLSVEIEGDPGLRIEWVAGDYHGP